MKLVLDEGVDMYNKCIEDSVPSKFDKWIGYDCGPIRYDNPLFEKDQYDMMYYESWIFVGRQPNGKYAFYCNDAPDDHKDLIGTVIEFNTFKDATYMIAFPGRGY